MCFSRISRLLTISTHCPLVGTLGVIQSPAIAFRAIYKRRIIVVWPLGKGISSAPSRHTIGSCGTGNWYACEIVVRTYTEKVSGKVSGHFHIIWSRSHSCMWHLRHSGVSWYPQLFRQTGVLYTLWSKNKCDSLWDAETETNRAEVRHSSQVSQSMGPKV